MKVISIIGYHKVGKTTLVERLVEELSRHGSVGTLKHTRDEIVPLSGDTERHLRAGAKVTIGITPTQSVKITKNIDVNVALGQLLKDGMEYVVVEGFKESDLPKIAIGDVEASHIVARVDINASGDDLAKIAMAQPAYVAKCR